MGVNGCYVVANVINNVWKEDKLISYEKYSI